ncbi:MAG: DUF6273 domain-containing protein [Lachnospiraceae bacterium]|nr:DUF6273 domain-containing protein [Lachnospiraceae bacterium]
MKTGFRKAVMVLLMLMICLITSVGSLQANAASYDFKAGDIVTFGSYEQDDNKENGKEPIEWIVLSNDDSQLFLLSKYALTEKVIDDGKDFDGTWAGSDLRKWLNSDFIDEAFAEAEEYVIAQTELSDTGTTDKVFLLSYDETSKMENIFYTDMDRRCSPTTYAEEQGVWVGSAYTPGPSYKTREGRYACYWWLRSVNKEEFYLVTEDGGYVTSECWGDEIYTDHVDDDGEAFYADGFGVRPAIKVILGKKSEHLIVPTGKNEAASIKTGDSVEDKITDISKAKKGDIITFGSYEQDNNTENGKEPIKWIVLSRTDTELFVLSKYGLDIHTYNDEEVDVTWKDCSLRKWLNSEFYDAAFSSSEKGQIKKTKLKNSKNPKYKTKGGKSTKDKVFVLSLEEATNKSYGFKSSPTKKDPLRRCGVTKYAMEKNARIVEEETKEGVIVALSWLRTPGGSAKEATYTLGNGEIRRDGWSVIRPVYAVRPAIVIKLK